MRSRGSWATAIVAGIVLLAGCASPPQASNAPDAPTHVEDSPAPAPSESDESGAVPSEHPTVPEPTTVPGQAAQNAIDGRIYVSANSNTWEIVVTEAGPADLGELVMYDSDAPAEQPSARQSLLWVCFDATQTSGFPGSWVGDDLRFEIVAEDGTRYDHVTAIDYAMADDAHDLYYAQGHDLDEPYRNVCALFLVPRDVDASTVAIVPDDGIPLELDL